MKKCIVMPDSFKGTLSATEFCDTAKKNIKQIFPACKVISWPIADGGEGTTDCFLGFDGYRKITVQTFNAFMEPFESYYAVKGETAVIELAKCAGLPQVCGRENPAKTTTYGAGIMIKHAINNGCKKIILGLGGSCTNDAGTGMAAALGVQFYNRRDQQFLPVGGNLSTVTHFDTSRAEKLLDGVEIMAMCDIDNPLHGPNGAAYIFGPQKGANPKMVKHLDKNLQDFSRMINSKYGIDQAWLPGAGAAGGAGYGVSVFMRGKLEKGIDLILDMSGFEQEAADADCIITGEGSLDRQSLSGKAVVGISRRAKKLGVPVIAVVGQALKGFEKSYDEGVSCVFTTNLTAGDFEKTRAFARQNLDATLRNVVKLMEISAGFGK